MRDLMVRLWTDNYGASIATEWVFGGILPRPWSFSGHPGDVPKR
jgi:hypothetical protein